MGSPLLGDGADAVSRYAFIRQLNSGSFGDVYLGVDTYTGEEVAIKVLVGGVEGDLAAVERELYFCQRVEHPNIIKTFDVLHVGEDVWFISEFCVNGDLFGSILPMEGVGDEARIKKYFSQLVDAVAYLHTMDIVHRDVKPENCLLTAEDDLKLCDFGLSGFESDDWEAGVGTFPYMAPEVYQLRQTSQTHSHKATDVWSCGITLYTMLIGMLPWDSPSVDDPDYEIFLESKGRFSVPYWSETLHELLMGMLHWNPAKRFTIHEVQQYMQDTVDETWHLPGRNELAGAPVHSTIARLLEDTDMRRPRSPNTHDYIVFGSVDGFREGSNTTDTELGEYLDRQHHYVSSPSPPVSPEPVANFGRNLLPPRRRTRYDSDMCEIEFSPYVNTDELLVVRQSWDSSTEDENDDEDEDADENNNWFNAGQMSFNHLPKFDQSAAPSGVGMPSIDALSPTTTSANKGYGEQHHHPRPCFTFGEDEDENEGDADNVKAAHLQVQQTDSGVDTSRSWVDMDREMSFSVLPEFSDLKIAQSESDDDISHDSGLSHDDRNVVHNRIVAAVARPPSTVAVPSNVMPVRLRTGSAPPSRPPSVIGISITDVSS